MESKYLHFFETNNERETYEASAEYIEPYVSLVDDDDSVHYNVEPAPNQSEG